MARPGLRATATAMLVDTAVRRGVRGLVGVGSCVARTSACAAGTCWSVRCSVAPVHLEDQDLVNRCMAAGVLGLDLEVASFYTVARLREAAATAILTVNDGPARGACADSPLLGEGARLALELAVSLALEMEQAR